MTKTAVASLLVGCGAIICGASLLVRSPHAHGLEVSDIPEEKVQAVRQRCTSIQARLTQLHNSDAVTRVNVGQGYDLISSRLMTPFTSRATLTQLDTVDLATSMNKYERARRAFVDTFRRYEENMKELQRIDCEAEPAQFYQKLTVVRELRRDVQDLTHMLNDVTITYRNAAAATLEKPLQAADDAAQSAPKKEAQ
ncbi:hypothetical protein HG444_002955 [Candidatus Saccharibacteria bacterium]|jgi:hypothetical protein|nr:hypothetical protein [Candidatus Saccharibacteria bacterium]